MRFTQNDIGGEIISIITRGMYDDPKDALREYVQNAVDAESQNISIKIRQNLIIVQDDGNGMDETTMRKAVRVGVSEKNPKSNVGFMGIGLYSSFHLCDNLTIYSKISEGTPHKLNFKFRAMRDILEFQKENRLNNVNDPNYSQIALQTLLENNIDLVEVEDSEFPSVGTRIELSGVEVEFYNSLSKFNEVANYLEKVIPLPFSPNFRYGQDIQNKIQEVCSQYNAKFELVNLRLQINDEAKTLYRPYSDADFVPAPQYPFFKELKTPKEFFGLAWGCLNEDRNVLKNTENRGFLIRKQGFAIGTRHDLVQYFKSQKFFNRYVGEFIIVHPKLLPNGPRSDFEYSDLRTLFQTALRDAASYFNQCANQYQEYSIADEEINEAIDLVKEYGSNLDLFDDNGQILLNTLYKVDDMEKSLEERLKKKFVHPNRIDRAKSVSNALKDLSKDLRKNIEIKKNNSTKAQTKSHGATSIRLSKLPEKTKSTISSQPKNLIEAIEQIGIELNDDVISTLSYLDQEYVQIYIDSDEAYLKRLLEIQKELEELINGRR